jgi:4'-phosphopantetheinyl transferase
MVYQVGEYEQLCANQVHLCLTCFDDSRLDGLLDDYRRLLTVDELAQGQRFHFAIDRRRYLVTRALLRCTLSRYVDIDPADWRFAVNQYGRPHIASASGRAADMHFNVSHTNSLMVVGVSVRRALGVDTENVTRRESLVHLADRFFAEHEAAALKSLALAQQHVRFFEYWTLKEAYIKARGMGLSIPLDHFSFDMSQPSSIALSVDPRLGDDAARWAFWQWLLDDGYLLALCAERTPEAISAVRLWRGLPLSTMTPFQAEPSRISAA